MTIFRFIIAIMSIVCFLLLLNLIRLIRISTYHLKYKDNCKSNNYLRNIKFYLSVKRLFSIANVHRVDLRNLDYISEHLEVPEYEDEINICFEKAKALFWYRMLRPWYVFSPRVRLKSAFLNVIVTIFKCLLSFPLSQVVGKISEILGIDDILWGMLVAKFPFLAEWLNLVDLFLSHFRNL